MTTRTYLTPRQEQLAICLARTQSKGIRMLDFGEIKAKTGYTKNSVRIMASKASVKQRVAEIIAEADSDAVADVRERKERLTKILRADLADFQDETGGLKSKLKDIPNHEAVAEYEVSAIDDRMIVKRKLKLRDPIAAIDSLNKMERIGAPETVNNFIGDVKILVVYEERKKPALTE